MTAEERHNSRVGFSRFLGVCDTVALGFSVSFGLVLVGAGREVLALAANEALIHFGVAAILFLPILLSYAEMAAGRPGNASPFQISRSYGSIRLSFLVGWLMLSGLLCAAAILSVELGKRLAFAVTSFFSVDIDALWFLILAVVAAAGNEWLASEDRWRSRTLLVWAGVVLLLGVLVFAAVEHPVGGVDLDPLELEVHDLTMLALLAAGLWFADLLLNYRRQMQRPDHTLRVSLLSVWIATMVAGILVGALVLRSPSLIMEYWPEKLSWGEARLELLLLVIGVLFVWLGLSRLVSRAVRLTGAMASNGFLPTVDPERRSRRTRAFVALTSLGVAVVVVARWVPEERLLTVSAASFLIVTALVTFPHARRPARDLPENRRNRLPFHPLFPGLSVALSVALAIALPRPGLGILLAWTALGAVVFFTFARRRGALVLQEETLVGEVEDIHAKKSARILIGATDTARLPSLLRVGSAIARQRRADLIVLRVLGMPDELSLYSAQRAAEREWQRLDRDIEGLELEGVQISTLVRIAPSIEAGILSTSREYDVDLVVLGAEELPREAPPSTVLSKVFSATAQQLLIVKGRIDHDDKLDVVVGTGGGPHAPAALTLGADIAGSTGGSLELVSVVARGQTEAEAEEAIRLTLERADAGSGLQVSHRTLESGSVESGLLEASRGGQILVVGASVDRLLRRTVLDGLSLEVARVREGSTLVVKRAEAAMRFWQRRLWELLARSTPTLTISERADVYSQMRHLARANVDFYTLISLSSAIAILGLLLDSAAVIIGAMLVAPLMSPILATAQGIVQGNPQMIQRAGASTFKGMSISIVVSTLITILQSDALPTGEILARTSPNLLDLGVALAAGAAAAYATSRSSVASALPGVAISVALVPPLCVVGYGLGTSQFWISAGAFLLFLTNLAGIILVGALIFVLLGFRPTRVEREAQVRKAAVIAILSVMVLVIPLGLATQQLTRMHRLEAQLERAVSNQTDQSFSVRDFRVTTVGSGYSVEGTIYAYQGFETEKLFEFQQELTDRLGVPVRLRMTIVPATLSVVGAESKGPRKGVGPVVRSNPD